MQNLPPELQPTNVVRPPQALAYSTSEHLVKDLGVGLGSVAVKS